MIERLSKMNLRNYPKQLFCETLMRLSEETPLEKITVTSIIKEAGTARQTFYNHFRDINDLVSYLPINHLSTHISEIYDMGGVAAAYRYAIEHKSFFRQLPYHSGQNNFRESFIVWLEDSYYERYISNEMPPEERMRRMLAIDLYVSGVTDLFLEWCKSDLSWPLEIMLQVTEEAAPAFVINQQHI